MPAASSNQYAWNTVLSWRIKRPLAVLGICSAASVLSRMIWDRMLSASATYSSGGNRLVTSTDALGQTTTYSYTANTNVLNYVLYPNDTAATKTDYSYDSMYRMLTGVTTTTDTGLTLRASYQYTDDLLTKLSTPSTDYTFTYGNFGLRTAVKAGSLTLASYTYEDVTNYLKKLAYGNGDSVEYTYNQQGQVTSQTYEDGDVVTYRYSGIFILSHDFKGEAMKDWLVFILYLLTLITGFVWHDTQNMNIKGTYLVLFFIASCVSLYVTNQRLKKGEKSKKEEADKENNQ